MQNRNYKTKSVVEAGLNAAIVAVIMLLNAYVPAFSLVGTFLLPIPITLLYVRNNLKVTISAVFVSAILVSLVTSPINAFAVAIIYGLTGIALGYCIREKKKYSHTIALLTIATAVGTAISYSILAYLVDKNGIVGKVKELVDMFQQTKTMTESMYTAMGVAKEQYEPMLKAMDMFTVDFVLTLLPALLLLVSVLSAYINYAVTKSILKRLKYELVEIKPYSEIYVDNRIGAVVIIIACLGVILSSRNIMIGKYLQNSSLILLQMTFILDGTAVAAYYLKNRFKLGKPLVVIILLFAAFSQGINPILIIIGLADLIFDFRKLDPNRPFKRKAAK